MKELLSEKITHDLKNLIGNFYSLNLMATDLLGNVKESTELIKLSDHLYEQGMLLLAQLSKGLPNGVYDKAITCLNDTLLQVCYLYQVQASRKGVHLEHAFPHEGLYCQIPKHLLIRLIDNLLSNAVKFTKRGGYIKVSLQKQEQAALLCVEDTGIGIPKKWQSGLFNTHGNIPRPGTENENSHGLGLSIVKEIADFFGVQLSLESEEEMGSRFCLEIPLCIRQNSC